jgi:hypothetical protein
MYSLNAASMYIKFASYKLKISHHHLTCSCWFTNSILCAVYMHFYDLFPYLILCPLHQLLVIALKLKAKKNVCMATILLFQILQQC